MLIFCVTDDITDFDSDPNEYKNKTALVGGVVTLGVVLLAIV